jgi:hypothetical protein
MKKVLLSIGVALLFGFSATAQVLEYPLRFNGGWGGQTIETTTDGYAPAVIKFVNSLVGINSGYGAVGEVGDGVVAWCGINLTNYTGILLQLGEGALVPIRIKVQTLQHTNGVLDLDAHGSPQVWHEYESEDCQLGATEVTYSLSNIPADELEFVRALFMIGAEIYDTEVNVVDFYATNDPQYIEVPLGSGDLSFDNDIVGAAYDVVFPWGGSEAKATIVKDDSNKVLKYTTGSSYVFGGSDIVSFPNITIPAGKTWGDIKAISFRVKVEADADPGIGTEEEISFGVDFGAGLPNSGARGINYGASAPNPEENFWKVEQVFKGSNSWQTIVQLYDATTMIAAADVQEATTIDFYLGVHKPGVTVLLDDIQFHDSYSLTQMQLQATVKDLNSRITDYEHEKQTFLIEIENLQMQLEHYRTIAQNLNSQITDYENEKQTLLIEIENLQTQLENCNTTPVFVLKGANIQVYPNPTTGIITVNIASDIKVYSLQGTLLYETFGTQVDLSAYPQGVYQLHINGEVVKIVKK